LLLTRKTEINVFVFWGIKGQSIRKKSNLFSISHLYLTMERGNNR
jgi:hypothetical protein